MSIVLWRSRTSYTCSAQLLLSFSFSPVRSSVSPSFVLCAFHLRQRLDTCPLSLTLFQPYFSRRRPKPPLLHYHYSIASCLLFISSRKIWFRRRLDSLQCASFHFFFLFSFFFGGSFVTGMTTLRASPPFSSSVPNIIKDRFTVLPGARQVIWSPRGATTKRSNWWDSMPIPAIWKVNLNDFFF